MENWPKLTQIRSRRDYHTADCMVIEFMKTENGPSYIVMRVFGTYRAMECNVFP